MRVAALVLLIGVSAARAQQLDVAPFAQKLPNATLQWDEERDIRELRVTFRGAAPLGASVEYWFGSWPWDPPQMPSIEDPMDDPWQGKWLRAATIEACRANECTYTFQPLAATENPRADKLPGVRYRRTLKVRLVCPAPVSITRIRAFTGSRMSQAQIRVNTGARLRAAEFSIYNGYVRSIKPLATGALMNVMESRPALPGSHDLTVVTVRAGPARTFSFCTRDLENGPIL